MTLNSSIRDLKGIGDKTAALFEKINIEIGQGCAAILCPRTYIQYPEPKHADEVTDGEMAALIGESGADSGCEKSAEHADHRDICRGDGSKEWNWCGSVFRISKKSLHAGDTYIFYGKVQRKNGRMCMEQPVIYTPEQYSGIEQQLLPVYSVPKGISNQFMTKNRAQQSCHTGQSISGLSSGSVAGEASALRVQLCDQADSFPG